MGRGKVNYPSCRSQVAVDHVSAVSPCDRRGDDRDSQTACDQRHDGLHLHGFLGDVEPGDEGLSRRDLWEPEGEIPSGYPTAFL
jgi:hypothetical protein